MTAKLTPPEVALAPFASNAPQVDSVYILDALHLANFLQAQHLTEWPPLSLASCAALVNGELDKYGLCPLTVHAARPATSPEAAQAILLGRRNAAGTTGEAMFLPKWARNPIHVLHETAHAILIQIDRDDNHGPIFMRLYIELLADRLEANSRALIIHARSRGVQVARARAITSLLCVRAQRRHSLQT